MSIIRVIIYSTGDKFCDEKILCNYMNDIFHKIYLIRPCSIFRLLYNEIEISSSYLLDKLLFIRDNEKTIELTIIFSIEKYLSINKFKFIHNDSYISTNKLHSSSGWINNNNIFQLIFNKTKKIINNIIDIKYQWSAKNILILNEDSSVEYYSNKNWIHISNHVKKIFLNIHGISLIFHNNDAFEYKDDLLFHCSENVMNIINNDYAFVGIRYDKTIIAWGSEEHGGYFPIDQCNITTKFKEIISCNYGFSGITNNDTIVSWGYQSDIYTPLPNINTKVDYIVANNESFAALSNGNVYIWGNISIDFFSIFNKEFNSGTIIKIISNLIQFIILDINGNIYICESHPHKYNYYDINYKIIDIISANISSFFLAIKNNNTIHNPCDLYTFIDKKLQNIKYLNYVETIISNCHDVIEIISNTCGFAIICNINNNKKIIIFTPFYIEEINNVDYIFSYVYYFVISKNNDIIIFNKNNYKTNNKINNIIEIENL